MGDRAAVQAVEAELPPAILLRRERQRHQDTDMGHVDSQPATHGHTEAYQAHVELFGAGHHVQDHAHVLRQLLHLLRGTRKGLAGDTQDNGSLTTRANPI